MDDVRAIVQRAVKDLTIEQSLKNYEAVWLSKVFALRAHVRNTNIAYQMKQDKENNAKDGVDPNVSCCYVTSDIFVSSDPLCRLCPTFLLQSLQLQSLRDAVAQQSDLCADLVRVFLVLGKLQFISYFDFNFDIKSITMSVGFGQLFKLQ